VSLRVDKIKVVTKFVAKLVAKPPADGKSGMAKVLRDEGVANGCIIRRRAGLNNRINALANGGEEG
jgi:hypothetical protein